jgi:hypothetical protein
VILRKEHRLNILEQGVKESGGIAPPFLSSKLDKGELLASRLDLFFPGE